MFSNVPYGLIGNMRNHGGLNVKDPPEGPGLPRIQLGKFGWGEPGVLKGI